MSCGSERCVRLDSRLLEQGRELAHVLGGVPNRALEHLVPARGAEVDLHFAVEVLVSNRVPPPAEALPDPLAERGDVGARANVVGGRGGQVLVAHRHPRLVHVHEGVRDLEQVVHQHPPRAGPVRKLVLELAVRHLAGEPDGGLEHVPVASGELGGREVRTRVLGEAEEVDDILDDLAKTNCLDTIGTERAPNARRRSIPSSSSRTLTDSNSIPRTERYSFTLRQSVGLPEDRDGFGHAEYS